MTNKNKFDIPGILEDIISFLLLISSGPKYVTHGPTGHSASNICIYIYIYISGVRSMDAADAAHP